MAGWLGCWLGGWVLGGWLGSWVAGWLAGWPNERNFGENQGLRFMGISRKFCEQVICSMKRILFFFLFFSFFFYLSVSKCTIEMDCMTKWAFN